MYMQIRKGIKNHRHEKSMQELKSHAKIGNAGNRYQHAELLSIVRSLQDANRRRILTMLFLQWYDGTSMIPRMASWIIKLWSTVVIWKNGKYEQNEDFEKFKSSYCDCWKGSRNELSNYQTLPNEDIVKYLKCSTNYVREVKTVAKWYRKSETYQLLGSLIYWVDGPASRAGRAGVSALRIAVSKAAHSLSATSASVNFMASLWSINLCKLPKRSGDLGTSSALAAAFSANVSCFFSAVASTISLA